MREVLVDALVAFDGFVLVYYLLLNSSYLVLVVAAAAATVRALRRPPVASHDDIFANPLTPGVSVVMPAYNEAASILESTRASLGLRYPELEVIVVDDGSTDDTFSILQAEFDLVETPAALDEDVATIGAVRSVHVAGSGEPLVVIRKENGGRRADALNAALNAARHPLVCFIDADSILEEDALLHVARPFVDDPDRVVATGGVIRAVNGSQVYRGRLAELRQPRGWVARIQIVEYLRSFLVGRTGWSRFGSLLVISGAFGLFRRDLLVEIGGYDASSLGEDADVVVALHRLLRDQRADHRIVFVPEPACWTEVPGSMAVLARQRRRWSHGLAQILWKQRRMIGNPRYGRVGVIALPYYLVFELLGPVVELLGLPALLLGSALGVVSWDVALAFAAVAILYGAALSIASLVIEEVSFRKYRRWRDLWIGIAAAFMEHLGYRQLHAWWRLRGLVTAVRGGRAPWGEMARSGFETAT